MKFLPALLFASLLCACASANAAEAGLQIDASIWKGGNEIAAPRITGKFGTWISTEIAQLARIEAMATQPDAEGYSQTMIKMYVYRDGKMAFAKEMHGKLRLSGTPFFAFLAPQSGVRFMVDPRLAVLH